MKIPKRININYKTFKIIESKSKTIKDGDKRSKRRLWGHADPGKNIIRLAQTPSKEEQANVFLHEIIHSCLDIEEIHDGVSEKVVNKLSKRLYQVIKDNKLRF